MKVKFIPQNVEFEVNPDQSVMKLAQANGIYIKSICGGLPSCAECRVRVVEGDQNVLPPSSKELTLIGTGYFIDQRRLSCQLKCFGDVTIDLTEQIAKQQIVETRRPQGSKKPETEASHAVSGNLIQQDDTLKTVAQDLEKRQQEGPRQGRGPRGGGGGNRGGRGGRGGGQGGGQNQNRNQTQNAARGDGRPQQGSASGNQQQQNPNQRQGNSQNPNRGNPGNRNNNRGGGQQGRREGGGGNQGGRGPGG